MLRVTNELICITQTEFSVCYPCLHVHVALFCFPVLMGFSELWNQANKSAELSFSLHVLFNSDPEDKCRMNPVPLFRPRTLPIQVQPPLILSVATSVFICPSFSSTERFLRCNPVSSIPSTMLDTLCTPKKCSPAVEIETFHQILTEHLERQLAIPTHWGTLKAGVLALMECLLYVLLHSSPPLLSFFVSMKFFFFAFLSYSTLP